MNIMVANFSENTETLWPKIKAVLEDKSFDLLSYSGLAERLRVEKKEIEHVVYNHLSEIRFSPVRANNGERLFTLAGRPKNWREFVSEVRHAFVSLD